MDGKRESDRVVVVAAGFGVWQGGRHILSGPWSEIARVVASRTAESDVLSLRVELRSGAAVDLPADLAGWSVFLRTLTGGKLPGMLGTDDWLPELTGARDVAMERVLYTRPPARPRRTSR